MKKAALVLACDDNFIAYTSCVARRIVRHASENFPIFVLADNVSEENRAKALSVCAQIEFLDVAPLLCRKAVSCEHRLHAYHIRKITAPDLLPRFDQALYLDSDIAVLGDVAPLVFTNLTAAPVAAAHDLALYAVPRVLADRPITSGRPYFNGGVALYDLKAVKGIFERAQQFSFDHPERCTYADQDALNHVLDGRWQVLDWRWNVTSFMLDKLPARPIIRHVAGHKPWGSNKSNIEPDVVSLWQADLADSPWPHLFKPAEVQPRSKRRWLKTMIHQLSSGQKGRSARFKRDITKSFGEIERTVGQLATPLL